jgi:hypothetical protein
MVAKRYPSKDLVVSHVTTSPHIMASVERTEIEFIFKVVDERGETAEDTLSESTSTNFVLTLFWVSFFRVYFAKDKEN